MKKITVKAHSDIALVKYWGQKNKELIIPANGSISISLDGLSTTTTVEFDKKLKKDEIVIGGESQDAEVKRATAQLDRIRELALSKKIIDKPIYARIFSENNFPKSTGLSSSASGFAALTLAASKAIGLTLRQSELSALARRGSGSACRCVCGGIVEWHDANTSEKSFAETIYPAKYLPVSDLIVVVTDDKKEIGSSDGHLLAETSPFFSARQAGIKKKLKTFKSALKKKDFLAIGELAEAEALEFHSILLTSRPTIVMFQAATLAVIHAVRGFRKQGIPVFFTMNTGANVHVLTLPKHAAKVKKKLKSLSGVMKVIESGVSNGPEFLSKHLF